MWQIVGFEEVGASTMKWHHLVYYDKMESAYQRALSLDFTLTSVHQRIVQTLDWLNMDRLMGYAGKQAGRPAGPSKAACLG